MPPPAGAPPSCGRQRPAPPGPPPGRPPRSPVLPCAPPSRGSVLASLACSRDRRWKRSRVEPAQRAAPPAARRPAGAARSHARPAQRDRGRGARRLPLRRGASRDRAPDRAHALPGHAAARPGHAQPPRGRARRRARCRHGLRGHHGPLRGLQRGRRGRARAARRAALPQHRAGRPPRQGAARGGGRDPRPSGGSRQLPARAGLAALRRRAARPPGLRDDRERAGDHAGGSARDALRRAVARTFPARGPRPPAVPRIRPHRATGTLRLTRRDLAQAYLVRLLTAPREPRAALALSLALEIVGADPDARLFQEVRERLGLGYDLGATVEQGRDWAVAVLSASAARDQARRLRETIDRVSREATAGFSAEELARARQKVRYRFARLADSRQDRATSHATRAACGLPSLARAAAMVVSI